MSNSDQFERLGQGEQISASQWNALSGAVEGLARTQTSDGTSASGLQMTRGPFGAVLSSRTNPPFWVRITGKGDGLTTRLSQAVTAGDQWIWPSNLSDPDVSLLPPFEIALDGERLTVKEVAGSPLVPKWILAGAASRSHDYGDAISLPGTVPYAFVEVQQTAPGVWQNRIGGRWGLVQDQPTDADVVGDSASPPDATPDNSIALAGSVLAARAARTSAPAFEVNAQAVAVDGTVIAQAWLDAGGEYYLFQAPAVAVAERIPALLTGSSWEQVQTTLASFTPGSGNAFTLTLADPSVVPTTFPFYLSLGTDSGEVVRIDSVAGGTYSGQRNLFGVYRPLDFVAWAPGTAAYLRVRQYEWVEAVESPPGVFTRKAGGRNFLTDGLAYGPPLTSPGANVTLTRAADGTHWNFDVPPSPTDPWTNRTPIGNVTAGVIWFDFATPLFIQPTSNYLLVQAGSDFQVRGSRITLDGGGTGGTVIVACGGAGDGVSSRYQCRGQDGQSTTFLGATFTGGILTNAGSGDLSVSGSVTAGAGITAGGTVAAGGDVTAAGNIAAVGSVTGATLNGSYSGGSF